MSCFSTYIETVQAAEELRDAQAAACNGNEACIIAVWEGYGQTVNEAYLAYLQCKANENNSGGAGEGDE